MHGFVARAEAAGVRHLVLLSGHGADTWGDSEFGHDMLSAEDAVRSSSLLWTVLRSANFAQNFDEENFHAPLVAGELALPAGEVTEPFIDLEDVADVAATVLQRPVAHSGKVYELTGARAVTFAEATDLISRASGRTMAYRQISPDRYEADLLSQGLTHAVARSVTAMFVMMGKGLIAGTTSDVAGILGRPPHPFEDFVVRAAAAGAWDR